MKYNELLALASLLIDEKIGEINAIQGKRGVRGPKGSDGESFSWNEHKEEIFQKVHEARLKFSDLTEEELNSLKGVDGKSGKDGERGPRGLNGKDGKDGHDGKDFNWDDCKDEVFRKVLDTKLKFSDLTIHEKDELRGEKGPRGQRGRQGAQGEKGEKLSWDECKDNILKGIENNKLTFSQLTDKDKKELQGDRGLRGYKGLRGLDGKDGKDFVWDDHKEKIKNEIYSVRFKYEDLTDDQKYELKGSRGQRGSKGKTGNDGLDAYEVWCEHNEGTKKEFLESLKGRNGVPGLRGVQGPKGEKGVQGLQGADGEDATFIIDVFINESMGKFSFVFVFNNGRRIETKEIDKPRFEQLMTQTFISSGGGGKKITVYDEGVEITDCLEFMDFTGNYAQAIAFDAIANWNTLAEVVPSMADYMPVENCHVQVRIEDPKDVNLVSSNVTIIEDQTYYEFSTIGNTVLMPLNPVTGIKYYVTNFSGGQNIIDGNGQTILGETSHVIYDAESFKLIYNGTEWKVI